MVHRDPGGLRTLADALKQRDAVLLVAAGRMRAHLVLRRIGEGTVTYVANIYKYYIAYKLVEEQRAVRENARRDLQEGGSNPQ